MEVGQGQNCGCSAKGKNSSLSGRTWNQGSKKNYNCIVRVVVYEISGSHSGISIEAFWAVTTPHRHVTPCHHIVTWSRHTITSLQSRHTFTLSNRHTVKSLLHHNLRVIYRHTATPSHRHTVIPPHRHTVIPSHSQNSGGIFCII
jgi:hypothetical protein